MLCVYRISDFAQGVGASPSQTSKPKLLHADKLTCLENFLRCFGKDNLYLIADRCSEETISRILALGIPVERILRTEFGSGAYSFLHAVRIVLSSPDVPDDTPIYLVEDDYLHLPGSREAIVEGLEIAPYVTCYFHPDKIAPRHASGGEQCVVYATPLTHWRTTASTTMTFAARKSTLREDEEVYQQFCHTGYPYDHEMFLALGGRGRKLIHPIPGLSTHCELAWLSPNVDWSQVR